MLTPQSGFQHLEDAFIPRGYFIAIGIFKCGALNPGHVLLVVSAETIAPFAEQIGGIVRPDVADHVAIRSTHRLQNVSFQRSTGIPHQNNQPFTSACQNPLGNRHQRVNIGLARFLWPRS
jgi:hypothetical protein